MAELSQVLATITNYVELAIYPNGTSQPSVTGVDVNILSGWVIESDLYTLMKSGKAVVAVYPTNQERVVTKFGRQFEANMLTTATLTATTQYVLGVPQVTLTGTVTTPESVVIVADKIPYAYIVNGADTLSSIATALATLIPGASSVGAVITLSDSVKVMSRVSSNYTATQELSRQERVFMITCYAPNDTIRTALAGAIDITMKQNYRMLMPDNIYAQIFYSHNDDFDALQKSLVYKRILYYIVQYATSVTNNYMTVEDMEINTQLVNSL